MLTRLLLLALLLLPLDALAAWSSIGTLGGGNSAASGTTVVVTTTAQLDAGNVGVCVIAKDESGSGTTDGTGNAQFTSIADSGGTNVWVEDYEWCNMQTSTASNGACVAIYHTLATANLASGGTITATVTSVTSKAMSCWEFGASSSAPKVVQQTAGANGLANDAADPGSMTVATTVSAEHLFIRVSGCESNVTTYTADTDYTTWGTTNNTANTGTLLTSMGVRGEHRIANESTSAASDPTYTSADCASAMISLDELTQTRSRFWVVP